MPLYDLSKTTFISFEINNDCNLKNQHDKCPINIRKYRKHDTALEVDDIVNCIIQAKELNV